MTDGNGHSEPATPQEIWEILREISAVQQDTARRMQETDRQMQETDRRMQETDRQMQETDRQMQETDRRLQATDELITRQARAADRRMDKLDELFNTQWGKLIESLVEGDLTGLLQRRGIAVQHTVTNPRQNYGERRWEFDIVAINGEEVVVVEVKTTLRVPDIDRFVRRLNEFRDLMPEYASRRIYGAVAYLKAHQQSDVRAERLGLFVIRATGSSASITNREGFTPRTFGHRSRSPNRR
ncbi:MAG: hypothetical protein OXP69_14555 [Spirochaetaceae bacterium]|nr:hypothetical protein [Spirochaetaceae bacterium]